MNLQQVIANKKSLKVFLLALVVSFYWFAAQVINVYRFPVTGAVYELSAGIALIILLGLPVFSFMHWVKDKFDPRSLYLYSFLISVISLVILITQFS